MNEFIMGGTLVLQGVPPVCPWCAVVKSGFLLVPRLGTKFESLFLCAKEAPNFPKVPSDFRKAAPIFRKAAPDLRRHTGGIRVAYFL